MMHVSIIYYYTHTHSVHTQSHTHTHTHLLQQLALEQLISVKPVGLCNCPQLHAVGAESKPAYGEWAVVRRANSSVH